MVFTDFNDASRSPAMAGRGIIAKANKGGAMKLERLLILSLLFLFFSGPVLAEDSNIKTEDVERES
jgi:hypothetical protein